MSLLKTVSAKGTIIISFYIVFIAAVALAISRDGSSGGVIRIAVINEDGVERLLFTGKDIPQYNTDM